MLAIGRVFVSESLGCVTIRSATGRCAPRLPLALGSRATGMPGWPGSGVMRRSDRPHAGAAFRTASPCPSGLHRRRTRGSPGSAPWQPRPGRRRRPPAGSAGTRDRRRGERWARCQLPERRRRIATAWMPQSRSTRSSGVPSNAEVTAHFDERRRSRAASTSGTRRVCGASGGKAGRTFATLSTRCHAMAVRSWATPASSSGIDTKRLNSTR